MCSLLGPVCFDRKDDLYSEKTLRQKCSKFKVVKVNFGDGKEFYVKKLILVVKNVKVVFIFQKLSL